MTTTHMTTGITHPVPVAGEGRDRQAAALPGQPKEEHMIDMLLGAAVEVAMHNDRAVNLQRPSRGAAISAIREAATPPPKWKAFAECVLRRETGAVLQNRQSREDAASGVSSAQGRYQFLSAWQKGGPYMVRARLIDHGMPRDQAKRVRVHLSSKPIREWDGWWQDVLFNEVIDRDGWRHWYLPGSACNGLVPR